ncbi:hypothetical protein RCL1_006404 [Eukaryota sp. TZLM3-RCL]
MGGSLSTAPKLSKQLTNCLKHTQTAAYDILSFLGAEIITSWVSIRYQALAQQPLRKQFSTTQTSASSSDPSDGDVSDDESTQLNSFLSPNAAASYFRSRSVLSSFFDQVSAYTPVVSSSSSENERGTAVEAVIGALAVSISNKKPHTSAVSILHLIILLDDVFNNFSLPSLYIPSSHTDVRPLPSPITLSSSNPVLSRLPTSTNRMSSRSNSFCSLPPSTIAESSLFGASADAITCSMTLLSFVNDLFHKFPIKSINQSHVVLVHSFYSSLLTISEPQSTLVRVSKALSDRNSSELGVVYSECERFKICKSISENVVSILVEIDERGNEMGLGGGKTRSRMCKFVPSRQWFVKSFYYSVVFGTSLLYLGSHLGYLDIPQPNK